SLWKDRELLFANRSATRDSQTDAMLPQDLEMPLHMPRIFYSNRAPLFRRVELLFEIRRALRPESGTLVPAASQDFPLSPLLHPRQVERRVQLLCRVYLGIQNRCACVQ